jgi:hypothetical protein
MKTGSECSFRMVALAQHPSSGVGTDELVKLSLRNLFMEVK